MPHPDSNDDLPDDDDYDEDQRKPPDSYRDWWYHSDHLGSSTYLTDNFGRPSHYYETLPFGEMIVEHNQSSFYDNKYKFNGKELDEATQMYYYGARYYDPRISIFISVDPLAEQFTGWTPYHYVHQNPINLIDPTGMSADGWIEHSTRNGDKLVTYDAEINTKEEAIKKGYRNVEAVSEVLHYEGTSGSYTMNKDGTVDNNNTGTNTDVGFNPIRTNDGYYISENNPLKATASGLQDAGDALTYIGLGASITGVGAVPGGVLMTAGEAMNVIGTGIESSYLISQGKVKEGFTKFGISLFFIGTGNLGVKATQKIAGKEAVEQGLNNGAETLIQGTNTVIEKTIGADTEKMLNK